MGAKVSTLIFGFGGFYFLIRSLPKDQFGVWALFLTITTIVEVSRNGLIQNALIKLIHSNSDEDVHKIVTASWIINLFFSLLVAILMIGSSIVVSSLYKAEELQWMFLYYSVTLLLLVPFSQFNYLQQAKFSFSGIFWAVTVRQGFFFFIILIYYVFNIELNLIELVSYQIVSTFFGALTSYFCSREYLKYKWVIDFMAIRNVFHFGKYVMGTNISSLLYKSTDQLLIGHFLGVGVLAVYNSAIRLSNLIEYPATSVTEVVFPKSSAMFEKDRDKATTYFYERAVGLTMTVTVPIVIFTFIFAKPIIYVVAGTEYMDAVDILRVTILFGLFTPFSRQFGMAMDSSGRPHLNFLVLCISVIINILLNYIGILTFGMIGAAFATLMSYFIISVICYFLMLKIFRIRLRNVFIFTISFYQQAYSKVRRKYF